MSHRETYKGPNRNEWTTQPYICCERYAACDWKGHPLSAILIILFKFHLLLFAFCGRLFKHGENYNEAKHYLRWLFEAEHITLSLKWFLCLGCIVAFPLELGYLTELQPIGGNSGPCLVAKQCLSLWHVVCVCLCVCECVYNTLGCLIVTISNQIFCGTIWTHCFVLGTVQF